MSQEPLDTPAENAVRSRRRWRRWFRHLFVTLHYLLLALVLAFSAAIYIAFRTDSLEIVDTYVFEPLGIEYTRADGSLAEGFTLHDLRSEKMQARSLTMRYSLAGILKGDHTVDEITVTGLRIHLDDFIGGEDTPWPLPTFALKKVTLTNLQLISDYPVELDIEGRDGSFDGDMLDFKTFRATFKSRYADGTLQGSVADNAIRGNALLYPNATALAPYSGRFTDLPRMIPLEVAELSDERALLRGGIKTLTLKQDPTLSAENVALSFDCRYDSRLFDVDATYLLRRGEDSVETTQRLRYTFDGETTSTFEGVISSARPLPSNLVKASFSDSTEGFNAQASLDGSILHLSTSDYDRFAWEFKSDHQDLSFLSTLPEALRASPLSAHARGEYLMGTETLEGTLEALHDHLRFAGKFSSRGGKQALEGELTLPPDAPTWREWSHKPPSRLSLSLHRDDNTTRFQLSGDGVALAGSAKAQTLTGSGNYLGIYFDVAGNLTADESVIDIDALIPSAFATASRLRPIELHKGEYYDAEIHTKTRITLTDTLSIRSDISIPWYAAVLDSQRAFGGTDGRAALLYRDGNITVEGYRFEVAGHGIESSRPSYLHITPEGGLIIDGLYIYDTLLLRGEIAPDTSASLHLGSERFSYTGPEGSAHASADITFTRTHDANHSIVGNLTFLDAMITYLPFQQFKVLDDDIIIIQDVRPPSQTNLSMNLHITAGQPLKIQTKELDLRLIPDITLWRDPRGPMQILGMVSVPSGTATTAGKLFEIKHSEIYFGGDVPVNPYLDLTIGHEVDYKKILIYVTHTLESPIFLFSSDPVMSQNDIMSYLLFGSPASTSLGSRSGEDTSTQTIRADATNFMLGAGLKGLISGVTKMQIDTMNILTTQEGGMGFEVGARINKNLRVLYKNDTLSSILVQYQVNRWLRLDADIHELGQGINAVYIKDFRDFLPHNKAVKK